MESYISHKWSAHALKPKLAFPPCAAKTINMGQDCFSSPELYLGGAGHVNCQTMLGVHALAHNNLSIHLTQILESPQSMHDYII